MKIRGRITGRLRDLLFICIGPLLLLAFYVMLISKVDGGRRIQEMEVLMTDDLTFKSDNQTSEDSPELICNFENYVLGQPINQTDPCLVATVKRKMLVSPRPSEIVEHVPFDKAGVDRPSNIEKLNFVKKVLIEGSSKGAQFFFMESRAHDGELSSSTIRLETLFGWNGVLIEPQRLEFQKLLKKRKVWAVNTALCSTPHPVEANLDWRMSNTAGFIVIEQNDGQQNKTRIPCIPFYTILKALSVTVVDFLHLSIDGAELQVLKTIPFNNVIFKIMAIEHSHIPGESPIGQLKDFLGSEGYQFVKTITGIGTQESLFVYKSLYEQKQSIINTLAS